MKSVFARLGIPNEVISDNGPQYSSQEFKRFAEEWDFVHNTSSPLFPQSNGQVESMVKTVKTIIKKCKESNTDPYMGLLELRNTPLQGVDRSPAQLLMSRRLRSALPVSKALLNPETQNTKVIRAKLLENQAMQKKAFDKTAQRELPELVPGMEVRAQIHNKTWEPAVVTNKSSQPRSYLIITPDGKRFRRNRSHLRQSKEPPQVFQRKQSVKNVQNPPVPSESPVQSDPCVESPTTSAPAPTFVQPIVPIPVSTRLGRVVKKPDKLNL